MGKYALILLTLIFSNSCKNEITESAVNMPGPKMCNEELVDGGNKFTITLVSNPLINNGGQFTWEWTVQNSTTTSDDDREEKSKHKKKDRKVAYQNLSCWGMTLEDSTSMNSVICAEYSVDGVNWIEFVPTYQIDKDFGLYYNKPIVKFPFGTIGNKKSYYRLIMDKYFSISTITIGILKYGNSFETQLIQGIGTGMDS